MAALLALAEVARRFRLAQYVQDRISEMLIYPTNQAGGVGSVDFHIAAERKEFYYIPREYGCSYNAPYSESPERERMYLDFLRKKGWTVKFDYDT